MIPKPEDLTNAVIRADDLRRRARGQSSTRAALALATGKPSFSRLFIEPLFNLLGHLWGGLMYAMPWRLRKAYVQWVNLKMSKHPAADDPQLANRIGEVLRLAQDLKAKTGQWPGLFVLTSHPETEGPLEWLRFELVRQGLKVADAYTEVRRTKTGLLSSIFGFRMYPHPKGFVAIDPFALDTVSAPAAGFYSGWMQRIYLAWDRQPSTQSWIQKNIFLRGTGTAPIFWRLLACLKADIPVVMVLSGGLPYNARLLYAAREFVQRLAPSNWDVTKRQAQLELMEILMRPEQNIWPADHGEIPGETQQKIRAAIERWGVSPHKVDAALTELAEEFKLAVPYRARLWRALSARMGAKPLILVGVRHRDAPPHVEIAPPKFLSEVARDPVSFSKLFA